MLGDKTPMPNRMKLQPNWQPKPGLPRTRQSELGLSVFLQTKLQRSPSRLRVQVISSHPRRKSRSKRKKRKRAQKNWSKRSSRQTVPSFSAHRSQLTHSTYLPNTLDLSTCSQLVHSVCWPLKNIIVLYLRISALANKARSVAMKITSTGIQHQEAMKEALEEKFNELHKILAEYWPYWFKFAPMTCYWQIKTFYILMKQPSHPEAEPYDFRGEGHRWVLGCDQALWKCLEGKSLAAS